jgi:hypothetical protein
MIAAVGGCALVGEDPDDISVLLEDDEKIPGINVTKYSKATFSDSLDESDDQEMEEFANWYGFKKGAINDGVIQALTPNISETVSVGWSSDSQDPSEDDSQWVLYEFPVSIEVRQIILYGRTDTMPNYGEPGRNFPQDFKVYVTNREPQTIIQNWEDFANEIAYEYRAPARIRPTVASPGREHDMSEMRTGRYIILRITRNTGDYTQIGEFEVYGYPQN